MVFIKSSEVGVELLMESGVEKKQKSRLVV